MTDLALGIGLAVLAAAGLAIQSLAVRLAIKTTSVSHVIGAIFAVNLLILLPFAAVVEYPQYSVTPLSFLSFALAGILGSLLARVCYFIGIARIGASRTEPLKALFPVVAFGIAIVFLDETVTTQLILGIALVLGGSSAVVLESRTSSITPSGRRLWLDMLFPLTAALFLGIDPIFTKFGLAEGTPALVGLTIRIAAGAIGFGLYLAWRRPWKVPLRSTAKDRWIILASLANTVYLVSYYAALAVAPVTVVTPILGMSTLLVVFAAGIFLPNEERVTWKLGAAALVVVVGITFVVQA